MSESVTISTPSRIHFGLLRFAQEEGPSYGGLGMMIDRPRWNVTMSRDDQWSAAGPSAERALRVARRVQAHGHLPEDLSPLRLEVRTAIPPHQGLGGGTQLDLAVAAGVRALSGLPPAPAAELATLTGRGQRSAVGSHGFAHGGLIWETGRRPGESLGTLAERVALPDQWRIVLITPPGDAGLSGEPERSAFEQLPPVPETAAVRLTILAVQHILPAARGGRLDAFGQAIYEYGRLAGESFAAVQGGPYASPEVEQCVQEIRRLGVGGVGQSSWGPTVFAIVGDQDGAEWIAAEMRKRPEWAQCEIHIAGPDNHGARLESAAPLQQAVSHQRLSQ